MLSDEEQKKRAERISKLYNTPLKRKPVKASRYLMRWAVLSAVIFCIPAIYLYFILFFFNNISYSNLTDVQAAGIAFIVQFIGWGVLIIFCLKYFRETLYNHYMGVRLIFWTSLLVLVPFFIYLMQTIPGSPPQTLEEIMSRAGLFMTLSIGASIILLISMTFIAHKLSKSS